jgi:hypothetical protein
VLEFSYIHKLPRNLASFGNSFPTSAQQSRDQRCWKCRRPHAIHHRPNFITRHDDYMLMLSLHGQLQEKWKKFSGHLHAPALQPS